MPTACESIFLSFIVLKFGHEKLKRKLEIILYLRDLPVSVTATGSSPTA